MKQESFYCESCKRNTLHAKPQAGAGGLIALLLLGVLLIAYGGVIGFGIGVAVISASMAGALFTALMEVFTSWRCQFCGKRNETHRRLAD